MADVTTREVTDARHFAAWYFEADLLNGRYPNYPSLTEIRAELAGHDLACWCPLEDEHGHRVPCHADILLEIANQVGAS